MKSDPLQHSSPIIQTFFEKFDLFADAPTPDNLNLLSALVAELTGTASRVPAKS